MNFILSISAVLNLVVTCITAYVSGCQLLPLYPKLLLTRLLFVSIFSIIVKLDLVTC